MSWDTVVIGSGLGGLTAAVALARAGQKVLVLEQHDLPGGWTHSFSLDGYRFSPGVHYMGDLGEGGGVLGRATTEELLSPLDGSLRIYPADRPEEWLGDERTAPARRPVVERRAA